MAGLSKVNPDINTSEDVFAGFRTMLSGENTKHVEHIQFQKGMVIAWLFEYYFYSIESKYLLFFVFISLIVRSWDWFGYYDSIRHED